MINFHPPFSLIDSDSITLLVRKHPSVKFTFIGIQAMYIKGTTYKKYKVELNKHSPIKTNRIIKGDIYYVCGQKERNARVPFFKT